MPRFIVVHKATFTEEELIARAKAAPTTCRKASPGDVVTAISPATGTSVSGRHLMRRY